MGCPTTKNAAVTLIMDELLLDELVLVAVVLEVALETALDVGFADELEFPVALEEDEVLLDAMDELV